RLGFSWCSDSSECVHGDAACLASPDCGPAAPAGPSGSREAGGKDSSASNLAAQNIVPGRMRVFGCIKAEDTEIPDTWEELETSSVSTKAPSSEEDSRARSRLHKDLQNLNKAVAKWQRHGEKDIVERIRSSRAALRLREREDFDEERFVQSGCSVAENVPEDVCPTQKLAEELCPTQQLLEEVEEPAPAVHKLDPGFLPEKAQAYSRKSAKRRGRDSADSASSGLKKAAEKVASEVQPVQPVPRARDARLSFQQMVSLGRRLRGKQPTIERHEAFACDAAGDESKEPGKLEAKFQPEVREAEEPLALEEAPDGAAAADSAEPELVDLKAKAGWNCELQSLSCPGPEDKKHSPVHSEHREPVDCPEARDKRPQRWRWVKAQKVAD
ncbi:unnamed protein product, partial [Symbiodinium necroappetens]